MREPPVGRVAVLEVTTSAEAADVVSGELWALGAAALVARPAGPGRVTLVAGFADDEAAAGAAAALRQPPRSPALGTAARLAERVDLVEAAADAGLDDWRAFAADTVVGPLVVRPAWLDGSDPPGAVVVRVDPGRVFGHGGHPTTRLVLEALVERLAPGGAVLDVGCGSGVLSVAAAALGAGPVTALDVDPDAVRVTLANAAANQVQVDASLTPLSQAGGEFALVLANISGATLRSLAGPLAARVAPGGHLVLAGMLPAQAAEVAAAFCGPPPGGVSPPLTLVDRRELEGWAALVLRRENGRSATAPERARKLASRPLG
ncbi:MAG: 50S ribosomal protein L11 methyltransferase [Acidimicrobiales bacterium]